MRMNVLPRPRIHVQFSLRILPQEMDAEVWQRHAQHHDWLLFDPSRSLSIKSNLAGFG
jgi:hypothetical protein